MPVTLEQHPDGTVMVRLESEVHAKGPILKKAVKQKRLLNAVDHGVKPGKKAY